MPIVEGYDDDYVLDQLVAEARAMLARLPPGSGQQLAGPLNPEHPLSETRSPHFTGDEAERLHARLRAAGIACVRIRSDMGPHRQWSIVFAHGRKGVERMAEAARKAARRSRWNPPSFTVSILDDIPD